MVFGIRKNVRGVVTVVVLHNAFLHKSSDAFDAVRGQLSVVPEEPTQRLKDVLVFVNGVALHELPVLFYDLTDEGLHRLKTALAAACDIVKTPTQDQFDCLVEVFLYRGLSPEAQLLSASSVFLYFLP